MSKCPSVPSIRLADLLLKRKWKEGRGVPGPLAQQPLCLPPLSSTCALESSLLSSREPHAVNCTHSPPSPQCAVNLVFLAALKRVLVSPILKTTLPEHSSNVTALFSALLQCQIRDREFVALANESSTLKNAHLSALLTPVKHNAPSWTEIYRRGLLIFTQTAFPFL